MQRPRRWPIVSLVVAALAWRAGSAVAQPAAATSCDVLEIEASNSGAPSVDPKIGAQLESKLKKPPFSSWNTFKALGAQTRSLTLKKAESVALSHGTLGMLMLDSAPSRVRLGITLDDQAGKRVLDTKVAVDAGDWMAVGRSLKGDRGHIVAFRCGSR